MIHLTLTQKIKEKLKEAQSFIAKAERGTISNGTCISDYIKLDILDNCINVTVTNGATQFFESTIECGEAAGNGEVIVESRMEPGLCMNMTEREILSERRIHPDRRPVILMMI